MSIVALASLMTSAACANQPPISPAGQPLPAAEATNVRRTAVAEVQRIYANNPQPTATPNATPVPRPSCADAIWWHEARAHLGEVRTVQGIVVGIRPAPDGFALLELGQRYPDPLGVALLVAPPPAQDLGGKTVCVAGRIASTDGRPTMQVRDGSGLVVVN